MAKKSLPTDVANSVGTRDRILDVSARIFRSQGYADTTMNHIAEATGIRAASIYYHFRSKDELVQEILDLGTRRVFDAVRSAIGSLPEGTTFQEKVAVALKTHLKILHTQGDYTAANVRLFPEAPAAVVKRHMAIRRSYGVYWHGLLRDGQREGVISTEVDIEVTQMLLLGALNWSIQWFKPKSHNLDAVASSAASLLLTGLFSTGDLAVQPPKQL